MQNQTNITPDQAANILKANGLHVPPTLVADVLKIITTLVKIKTNE